ncbi:MAG: hemolysin III family protein [Patescibacteria group bacterium]
MNIENKPLRYPSNELTSGLLHLVGALFAIVVLVVLIVLGARYGNSWHVVGYSLYGAGLILLYVASASYHLIPSKFERAKGIARHLDHAMIFVLIAATYTPVTFLALEGAWRWSIFGTIWGLAILGVAIKLFRIPFHPALSTALYLFLGWLIVLAIAPLRASLSPAELALLFFGGLSYTLGVVFFALDKVLAPRKHFWMHEIFHVFVLGGSTLHTILMFLLL